MVSVDPGHPGIGKAPASARWSRSSWPRRFAVVVAIAVGLGLAGVAVLIGVYDTYSVATSDMEPSLRPGDRALARPTIDARHGQVVVFTNPRTAEAAIGRVVAVAGDTVSTRDGTLVVNGVDLVEPYLAPGTQTSSIAEWIIPDQHFYVLGDAREDAVDSRSLGAIRGDALLARVVARTWPPSRIGGV